MFKTIRTNRNDILAIAGGLLLLFTGLYYGKTYFPPLAYLLSFGYWLAIAAVVFFSPWFVIRITLPNTMGKFVNEWFEAAWYSLGKPEGFKVGKDGSLLKQEDPETNFQYAGDLQKRLKFTVVLYAVLVLAGSVIALAAFAQGISIPVL